MAAAEKAPGDLRGLPSATEQERVRAYAFRLAGIGAPPLITGLVFIIDRDAEGVVLLCSSVGHHGVLMR